MMLGQTLYCPRVTRTGDNLSHPYGGQTLYLQLSWTIVFFWNRELTDGNRAKLSVALVVPESINHVWSIDFMSDSLITVKSFRTLNIPDDYNAMGSA